MLAHPFLLENYLTNYILQRAFLSFDNPRGILTDYLILCTHYVVIRTTLIGIAGRYREQFRRSPYLGADYKERLRRRIQRIREKYRLSSAPVEYRPELWEDDKQLALFPL